MTDYQLILSNLQFLKFLLGGFFAYSVVVAYNVMTPFLMQNILNISATNYGYLALLIGIPYYLASSYNKKLVLKFGIRPIFVLGYILVILAGIAMMILSFAKKPNLSYIMIPMMIATFGQAFIFSNTLSCALQQFSPKSGGKSSAIFSSLQMIMVSIFSAIIATLPNNNIWSLALVVTTLGVCCAIVLITDSKTKLKARNVRY